MHGLGVRELCPDRPLPRHTNRTTPIRFGREGKPFYISGPYDNPRVVIGTLESIAGGGNYRYLTHLQ